MVSHETKSPRQPISWPGPGEMPICPVPSGPSIGGARSKEAFLGSVPSGPSIGDASKKLRKSHRWKLKTSFPRDEAPRDETPGGESTGDKTPVNRMYQPILIGLTRCRSVMLWGMTKITSWGIKYFMNVLNNHGLKLGRYALVCICHFTTYIQVIRSSVNGRSVPGHFARVRFVPGCSVPGCFVPISGHSTPKCVNYFPSACGLSGARTTATPSRKGYCTRSDGRACGR